MRVTVAVAEPLIQAANHVHVLLGKSTGFQTYQAPGYQDAQGNLYAVSSGIWTEAQVAGVTNPAILQMMVDAGTVPEGVDMVLAAQAQAAFSLHVPGVDENGDPLPLPVADPNGILAIASDDPHVALTAMSITRIPDAT